MAEINPARLLGDLQELRSFGARDHGVVRTSFSDVDMASREWLRRRMTEAGLNASIDGVGNVVGMSPNDGPALLVGSHSDTQPSGGWLDGALGVIYGLEVARALAEDEATRHLAVDAVAWIDEESSYCSCLGSRSYCGQMSMEELGVYTNGDGESVAQAIARVGLDGVVPAKLDPARHRGYLEAHIEQGPYLEETGKLIGVVTSIVGIRGCRIRFEGEQNHAGTTPMNRRKDAGVALFDYAVKIRERFQALAGPTTVWTIGEASLTPGAASIVPGRAEMYLQFRDPDEERLAEMEQVVLALLEEQNANGPVRLGLVDIRAPIPPTIMDAGFREHIAQAAERRVPDAWMYMPSAAGHDPMVVSHYVPCAMLFIPSINGISHDFAEDSSEADIVTGCQVLADATASILGEAVDEG